MRFTSYCLISQTCLILVCDWMWFLATNLGGLQLFGIGNDVPRLRPEATPTRYYNYDVVNFWLVPTLRVPVTKKWDIFLKANIRFADVKHYENSLLTETRPVGFSGGFYPQWSFGLLTDRRNKEPSTSQGYMFEASVRTAQRFLLSDFESYGANITFRQWFEMGTQMNMSLPIEQSTRIR